MDGRSLVRGAAGFDVRDDLRPGKPGPPVESDRFLGVEVDDISPRARVAVALTVLVPVVLSGPLVGVHYVRLDLTPRLRAAGSGHFRTARRPDQVCLAGGQGERAAPGYSGVG